MPRRQTNPNSNPPNQTAPRATVQLVMSQLLVMQANQDQHNQDVQQQLLIGQANQDETHHQLQEMQRQQRHVVRLLHLLEEYEKDGRYDPIRYSGILFTLHQDTEANQDQHNQDVQQQLLIGQANQDETHHQLQEMQRQQRHVVRLLHLLEEYEKDGRYDPIRYSGILFTLHQDTEVEEVRICLPPLGGILQEIQRQQRHVVRLLHLLEEYEKDGRYDPIRQTYSGIYIGHINFVTYELYNTNNAAHYCACS
ncbi:7940_t:CDS:2 [Ambispora gerdemannii]|uniref:7940_t:CDS:1 n=1 Tax=Ambispora gerdemannii TaxID=144530 RepID=A0A9N9BCY6_9GLOM|nr:7940_t:CDS:2 [Ambispora gerdemannii]